MSSKINAERATMLAKALRAATKVNTEITIRDGILISATGDMLMMYKVPGIPNMTLRPGDAMSVANNCLSNGEEVVFKQNKDSYSFTIAGQMIMQTPKSQQSIRVDYDAVYLKPTLVNNDELTYRTEDLKRLVPAADRASELVSFFRADGEDYVQLLQGFSYRDTTWSLHYGHPVSGPNKNYQITILQKAFTKALAVVEDETVTLKLDLSSKTKPAPVLISDTKSGLTAVFAPIVL